MHRFGIALSTLAVLLTLSCASTGTGSPQAGPETPRAPQRTLVMISPGEPPKLFSKLVRGGSGTGVERVFSSGLVEADNKDVIRPILLASLPELNTDNWQMLPDGRMDVTYKVKPGLTWHDGAPFTADDVALAFSAFGVTAMGWAPGAETFVEQVTAVDNLTFRIRWKQPTVTARDFRRIIPLPRHILGDNFARGDMDAFLASPYWTTEFVGLGPYRLSRWELGAFIEGTAFESYALGRPKIDRIRVIFGGDPDAVLATILAGGADSTLDEAIQFSHGVILKRQWQTKGEGIVLQSPLRLRYLQVEFRPELVNPKAILDVRARRAIAHAVDKQSLIDGLMEGEGQQAGAFANPQHPRFAEIDQLSPKFPFDPRRVSELLTEVGLTKQADGFYGGPNGAPFEVQIQGLEEKESVLLIDSFKRAGIKGTLDILSTARAQDQEIRSTFPALAVQRSTYGPPTDQTFYEKFYSANIATKEARFTGSNRGGYTNAQYDGLFASKLTTLDEAEHARLDVGLASKIAEDLPGITLYQEVRVDAQIVALRGPTVYSTSGRLWNLHEWEWA